MCYWAQRQAAILYNGVITTESEWMYYNSPLCKYSFGRFIKCKLLNGLSFLIFSFSPPVPKNNKRPGANLVVGKSMGCLNTFDVQGKLFSYIWFKYLVVCIPALYGVICLPLKIYIIGVYTLVNISLRYPQIKRMQIW